MRKELWIVLVLLLVIPGVLFTVSCAKKTVKTEASVTEAPPAPKVAVDDKAKQEELERQRREEERQRELARQRALEEERLREEQRRRAMEEEERKRQEENAKKIEAAKKKMFLEELVLFDFDSSVLTSEAQDRLTRKAQWLKDNPNVKVIIEGHCDERGTNAYNLALGDRRAEAAKVFLVDLGIPASRLTTISYGEERPFAQGHYEGAWRLNRRAHFVIE